MAARATWWGLLARQAMRKPLGWQQQLRNKSTLSSVQPTPDIIETISSYLMKEREKLLQNVCMICLSTDTLA